MKRSQSKKAPKKPKRFPARPNTALRKARTTEEREKAELNEMTSGTETSSLDPKVKAKVDSPEPARRKNPQAGDLQAISNVEDTSNESAAELIEEGQDREAEVVDALEDASEADQGEIDAHVVPEKGVPAFKDRNRL